MINVSNEFKTLMQERTDFKCNADITLSDGTVLSLDESAFTISNNSIVDAAGANTLPLGVAISRNIQIELINDEEQYKTIDFFGAKIRLYLKYQLSETTEKIEMGTFTVLDPETYGETVIITARDDMYKADKKYSTSLSFPATLASIFRDACIQCDIPFVTSDFSNASFIVQNAPSGELTFRQVFGYIAMLAVGNARINRAGYMEIKTYSFDTVHHELSRWRSIKADTSDITITGIQTIKETRNESGETVKETILYGNEGYVLTVDNPLVEGQEQAAVALIAEIMVGQTFRKFSGDHIGYPIAEFMDIVEITTRKGEVYRSVLTDIDFTFFGLTVMSNSAESVLRNSSVYSDSTSKAVIASKKLVEEEKTQRELAVEKLEQTLAQSSGLYQTSEVQEDGSTIYYLHDKPTLEDSTNVIKLTGEAIGLSTDGGKTYPYGFTVTGDMIAKILSAEGINADWINTGALSVMDSDGNAVFRADITTGEVTINGKSGNVRFEDTPIQASRTIVYPIANYTQEDLQTIVNITLGNVEATDADFEKYDFYRDGKISSQDLVLLRNMLNRGTDFVVSWKVSLDPTNPAAILRIWRESNALEDSNEILVEEVFKAGLGGGRIMLDDPVEDTDAISLDYANKHYMPLDAFPDPEKAEVSAGEEIPITLAEGEILQVTYKAADMVSGDITLKVNGTAPDGGYYSPAVENASYSGGIITYGGTTTYATAQFFMQIIDDRLVVWGSGIRGNGTGTGVFTAVWTTTEITSFSISRAGNVVYGKFASGRDGKQGEPGERGETGVGIASVEQTVKTTVPGGINIVTVTLTDGSETEFEIRNGQGGGGGSITATDDGAGNVVITFTGSLVVTDDGNGNVVIS